MCSQYTIKLSRQELISALSLNDQDFININSPLPDKILPYTQAPVVSVENGKRSLDRMQFSLIPKWSAEARCKFATHNARLDTVDEKPTFKESFTKRHCIVPMTGFVEPIYGGELAGNMVEFYSAESPLLFAAGIWDEWTNKKTGEILKSFSVITHEPIPFVSETGHDRSPVFLSAHSAEDWLRLAGNAKDFKAFLQKQELPLNIKASVDRPMKAGWEKRKVN